MISKREITDNLYPLELCSTKYNKLLLEHHLKISNYNSICNQIEIKNYVKQYWRYEIRKSRYRKLISLINK